MYSFQGQCYSSLSDVPNEILTAFIHQDILTETIAVQENKLIFWEEHYLRLMASMRILRMEIPLNFTLEYLEEKVHALLAQMTTVFSGEVKLSVVKMTEPTLQAPIPATAYSITVPHTSNVNFLYQVYDHPIDLYKDHYLATGLYSSLECAAQQWRKMAWTYVHENQFSDGIILNNTKHLVETLTGSLFLVKGNDLTTPSLDQGPRKTVYRNKLISFLKQSKEFTLTEEAISPFAIQKADEVFVLADAKGIFSVPQYRKKKFTTTVAEKLFSQFLEDITKTH